MPKQCPKCLELERTVGRMTATYTINGVTHTHAACPIRTAATSGA